MRCPYCGCLEDKVVDSRPTDEGLTIRRRRECVKCLLPNDGWGEVDNWTCRFGIDKDNPRIEVTVYEQGEY